MRIYEDFSPSADEWNITSTLELGDDGRFVYSETWASYAGSAGGQAEGRWRPTADGIVLKAERVDGHTYLLREAGREQRAVERGGVLDFGGGMTLRLRPPPPPPPPPAPPREREQIVPLRNDGAKPLTLILEPWGTEHVIAPGARVKIVARGPEGAGELEIVHGTDEVVVWGWSGSRVGIVPEQEPAPDRPESRPRISGVTTIVPAPDQPARAETPRPAVPPSPELTARIRAWIDALPPGGIGNPIPRLGREHGFLPLHATQIYLWGVRPDGVVMWMDHEAFRDTPEPETDPLILYAVLARGAETYPELREILPPAPPGVRRCERCGGEGWTQAPGEAIATGCTWCDGLGWHAHGPPR